MTSKSRPQRKRKQPEQFSPLRPAEEKELMQALSGSLRKIPANGNVSEDDVDENDNKEAYEEEEEKDDEEQKGDDYDIKWRGAQQEVKVNEFNQQSGPTKTLTSSKKVQKFFELIFSKKIWNHVCLQTNLYAQQRIQDNPDPEWKELTVPELKAWIGCLLAMGLVKLPNIKMYWDSTWKLSLVANRFTRDRFLSIKKYLHLADNQSLGDQQGSNPDRIKKIRPLLNLLVGNFKANYRPGRYLTADEDICKFKGRHHLKQYLRAKIIKWGYKIWKLCDAETAYVLDLDVYGGKKSENSSPYDAVMNLMTDYLDKHHVVVMDNYFTSVPLFTDLLERQTYACGTLRVNRKYLPSEFKGKKKMEPGDSCYWQKDNFVATLWQDKRTVRFLSTCCAPEGDDTVVRRRNSSDPQRLPCPPVVKIYAQYMGGVDRSDRMVRTYSVSRKSKKWWYRLFYYLLDTSLANSFILYQLSPNHDELSELDYLKQLALELISTKSGEEEVQPHPQRKKTKVAIPPRMTAGNHWPKKAKKQRLCQQCARSGKKNRRSTYICKACNVHLCIDSCFERYHTRR